MNFKRVTLVSLLCVALVSMLGAQTTRQSGVIRGIVTDNEGNPLPGMSITATSPALLGTVTDVTDNTGSFRLINLPPGTYTITAALDGFKTVKRTDIVVQVGQTFTVNLQTEPSTLKEEITVTGTPPVVDLQSNKVSNVVIGELLRNLPLNRDINGLFNMTAGSVGTLGPYSGSIHGTNTGSTAYEIDGVDGKDITTGGFQALPQFESVEEIEITTGGLPAQVGGGAGSFISVVTKAGGNQFHGQAQTYYTAKGLNQMLFTDEELASMQKSKPAFAKYDVDGSVSLGGPIIKDKLWFFGTLDFRQNEYTLAFDPVTLQGTTYQAYTNPRKVLSPFLKLSTRLNKNMRLFVMFNGAFTKTIQDPSYYRTYDATTNSNNKRIAMTGELNWMLGADTYVYFRAGWNDMNWSLTAQPGTENNIGKYDSYTYYTWNGKTTEDQYTIRRGETGSIRLTHFMDNVLGGNHEIGAGIEYIYMFDRLTVARGNPLTMTYYNGSPYLYKAQGWDRDIYGDGLITLSNMGPNKGDSTKDLPGNRLGGYLQDSFTLNNRLTINLGARYDWYWGGFGGGTSIGTDPSGLAYKLGQQVAAEIGWNPYAADTWDTMRKTMDFRAISPRVGISYDLFGDSKTALKASWGRHYEAMPVMWFCFAQANIQSYYNFYWWDNNGDGVCDDPGIDTYVPQNIYGFVEQDEASLRYGVAGKGDKYELKAPYNNELILAISHELARNLSVKLQYTNNLTRRDHTVMMYNTVKNEYLSSLEDAPAGFWVPFTTTVPAEGSFPEKTVTFYLPTNDYDWENVVWRQCSSPYSKRLYNGIELVIDKRYANGWALGGSVTYSKTNATADTEWGTLDPNTNASINYGPDAVDVPLVINIYGSFKMPLGFRGSFTYRHLEGVPLNNYVGLYASDSWMAANNVASWYNGAWVLLEPKGTHREASYDNVDFRLEKEFEFKFGTVSFFADFFNLLGNKYVNVGLNPGGVWYPDGENTTSGTRELDYNYKRITSVSGVRIFKLSARVSF